MAVRDHAVGGRAAARAAATHARRRHLLRPLEATALLALSYTDSDGCSTAATCRIRERLSALRPIARITLTRHLTLEELLPQMERLPHWPAVVAAYNNPRRGLACSRKARWAGVTR